MSARHRRPAAPVVPAALALGVLGATVVGGGVVPVADPGAVATLRADPAPLPAAVLPTPPTLRPREAITDLGL